MPSQTNRSRRTRNSRATRNGNVGPAVIAHNAVRAVAELTGRTPETVLALRQDDDEWKVTVEVVELSRIPTSTDLLGCYVVTLDRKGELVGYERVRRYQRGQTLGDDQ